MNYSSQAATIHIRTSVGTILPIAEKNTGTKRPRIIFIPDNSKGVLAVVNWTCSKMFRIIFLFSLLTVVIESRVFYVEEPRVNYYPTYAEERPNREQASKDLDMTFSAGDPGFNDDVRQLKKVFISPNRPAFEILGDIDRPAYYKWPEMPSRRLIYSDPVPPERDPKFIKFNDGDHKGEVVLELRVIANNNGQ